MCSYSIVKYLLFIFNFVFWLSGAALLGLAVYIRIDPDLGTAVEVAGVSIYTGSDILIGTGAAMLLVGFFGCFGAIKESACLLGLYFTCLLLVFGVEVGIGIWAFVNFSSVGEAVSGAIAKIDVTETTFQINIQQTFKCCGTNVTCEAFPSSIPLNCACVDPGTGTSCDTIANLTACAVTAGGDTSELIYTTPCSTAISDFIEENVTLLGGISLGIGVAEVLGMMVSLWLCCKIRNKDRDEDYRR